MTIRATFTTERVLKNTTILANENFSSLLVRNYGSGNVTLLDNITIEPGETFKIENRPSGNTIILIADDIPISFDSNPDRNLLVMKTFYTK